MWFVPIVILSPHFNLSTDISQWQEQILIMTLSPEFAVEGLYEGVKRISWVQELRRTKKVFTIRDFCC